MESRLNIADQIFTLILMLGLAMSVLYFDHSLHNYQVGKSSVFLILTGFSSIYLIARRWNEVDWSFSKFTIALFIFFLSFPLSYIFSVNKHLTLWGSYEYQGGLVFIFSAIMMIIAMRGSKILRSETLLWALIAPAVLNSLVSIMQSFDLMGATIHDGPAPRPWGLLGNTNIAGDYIATIIPLSLAFVFHKERTKKIFGTASFILMLYSLYLSECRGAMLGLLVGLGAMVLLYFHIYKSIRYWLPVYVGIFLVFITFFIMLFYPDLLPIKTRLVTFFMRYHAWKLSLGGIFENLLFGNGYKNFPFNFYPLRTLEFLNVMQQRFHNYEYFFSPHNTYLETVIERGFVGFLSMLATFGFAIFRIIKSVVQKNESNSVDFALLGAIVSFMVWSFANWETLATIPALFVIFLLVDKIEISEKRYQFNSAWINRSIVILFAPMFLYTVYHQVDLYFADYKFAQINRAKIPNRIEVLEGIIKNTLPPRHYYTYTYAQLMLQGLNFIQDNNQKVAHAKRAISTIEPNVEIQFEPNNTRYLLYKFYQVFGDYKRSEEILNDMLKLDPLHYTAMTEMAKIQLNVYRNAAKALDWLNRAIKIKPNYLDANILLAQFEVRTGNQANAKKRIEFMIQEYPKREQFLRQLMEQLIK